MGFIRGRGREEGAEAKGGGRLNDVRTLERGAGGVERELSS